MALSRRWPWKRHQPHPSCAECPSHMVNLARAGLSAKTPSRKRYFSLVTSLMVPSVCGTLHVRPSLVPAVSTTASSGLAVPWGPQVNTRQQHSPYGPCSLKTDSTCPMKAVNTLGSLGPHRTPKIATCCCLLHRLPGKSEHLRGAGRWSSEAHRMTPSPAHEATGCARAMRTSLHSAAPRRGQHLMHRMPVKW